MRSLVLLGGFALVVGCTQKVVVVWPDEPLKVTVLNCPATGAAAAESPDAAADPLPPEPEPKRTRLTGRPVELAAAGTVIFVEHAAGGGGGGVAIFEADARGSGNDCGVAASKKEVWRLASGARWDAQYAVEAGKVVCAEPAGGIDGEVVWSVRAR